MNQLIQVPFEGDFLHAIKTGESEDEVFVSVKRVCEVFGLSYPRQWRKLQESAWATGALKAMVAEDGKIREQYLLSLKSLPLWLATISPGRVAKELAEKLAKYQKQCRDVLYRHFFGETKEERPAIAEFAVDNWPRHQMRNASIAQRLQTASQLVEKYDQLLILKNRLSCERLQILLELKKLGITLNCC